MAFRCPDLPFLPGYSFNPMIGRTKFNMDPKFDFIAKGVPALVEKVRPHMFGPLSDKYPSVYPRGEVAELPAWIAFDKQILCFDAFFKETLQEVRGAPFQVRNVKIYFFLEDGTIQVIEPKVDNSGVAQGTLICRHRIRFPAPMDDNFYELLDFNIGKELEFYGRVYKITHCDKFTRNFLNRCGIAVPDPINSPADPYFELRKRESGLNKKKGVKKEDPLGKFLANDRKVLRFFGYWDDQDTEHGYLHRLEILYYLADDTIEIKEVMKECAKTTTFIFLQRCKLPKTYLELPRPGANSHSTVLNVLGSGLSGGRYIMDPLSCGRDMVDFYFENDLFIGSVLNCYGRKLVITDCDPFTREYYRVKYGLDTLDSVAMPEDRHKGVEVDTAKRELPPWNGYGSFEDSAQNCITVELKAPTKDIQKFLTLDRMGMDSHILRFEARMMSTIPENCGRQFVVSYYLADDTIVVFERGLANSGFSNKQFFARHPVALPGQDFFTSKPPEYYKSQDMFVGATIIVNSFKFILVKADEYALRYMELNPHAYPQSNIKVIMGKIREKLKPRYKDFVAENMPKEGGSAISYEQLQRNLCEVLAGDFTEHEMITISRAFASEVMANEKFDRTKIRAIALTELKKFLWDDHVRLKEYFIMRDRERTGVLSKKECYTVLRACRLPFDKDMVSKILQVIKTDDGDGNNLIYEDLLNFLSREFCPLPDEEPINIKHELSCVEQIDYKKVKWIDWCAFNKFLGLEDTFKEPPANITLERLKQKQ